MRDALAGIVAGCHRRRGRRYGRPSPAGGGMSSPGREAVGRNRVLRDQEHRAPTAGPRLWDSPYPSPAQPRHPAIDRHAWLAPKADGERLNLTEVLVCRVRSGRPTTVRRRRVTHRQRRQALLQRSLSASSSAMSRWARWRARIISALVGRALVLRCILTHTVRIRCRATPLPLIGSTLGACVASPSNAAETPLSPSASDSRSSSMRGPSNRTRAVSVKTDPSNGPLSLAEMRRPTVQARAALM